MAKPEPFVQSQSTFVGRAHFERRARGPQHLRLRKHFAQERGAEPVTT